MHSRLKPIAFVLALCAMLLRAAVPDGWMPGTDAGTPVTICTGVADMRGMPMRGMSMDHGVPQRHTRPCFAALVHAATGAPQPLIVVPVGAHIEAGGGIPGAFIFARRFHRPQAPRGPPPSRTIV
jgi:hypothetical protein